MIGEAEGQVVLEADVDEAHFVLDAAAGVQVDHRDLGESGLAAAFDGPSLQANSRGPRPGDELELTRSPSDLGAEPSCHRARRRRKSVGPCRHCVGVGCGPEASRPRQRIRQRLQGLDGGDLRYASRYLVAVDPVAREILATDFNRTQLGDSGRVQFEYKGWRAKEGQWTMFLYEDWSTDAPQLRWPERVGVRLEVSKGGALRIEDAHGTIRARPGGFPFDAQKNDIGRIRTAHLRTEGRIRRPAVYEWVVYDQSPTRVNEEEKAEQSRRIDPHAFFGRYDWIVLVDPEGNMVQLSQGSLTEDFGYRIKDGRPQEIHDLEVQWLQTEFDSKSKRHVPVRWVVDAPAWGLRAELVELGEHRGHGDPRPDGLRPVYRQVSVAGAGVMDGDRVEFFGMVEAIQD